MRSLKIETLNKEWRDRDEILLHAAFQVLVDFIDEEHPDRIVDWSSDKSHKRAWREIRSLYRWWKEIRPSRRSPLDEKTLRAPPMKWRRIPNSGSCQLIAPDKRKYARYYQALDNQRRLEQRWHKEDQRKLHRLIEVRGFLWT